MTIVDDILKQTTPRVSAPEALGVPPSVTTTLSEANQVAPKTLDELAPAEATLALDTMKGAVDESAEAAAAAAKAAQDVPLTYLDVVAARVKAVLIGELERRYLRWKHLRLEEWQQELSAWAEVQSGVDLPRTPRFTPEHRVVHAKELEDWAEDLHRWAQAQTPPLEGVSRRTPLDYFTGNRTGRSHTLLKLLFGERYASRLKDMAGIASPRRQLAAKWPRLVSCVWPPAGPNAVSDLRDLLRLDPADPALGAKVAEVLQDPRVVVGFDPADTPKAVAMIRNFAARYAPNGDITQLTDENLLEMMGKPLSVEEFLHRSLVAFDIMADEAKLIRPELLDKLLEVPGIESFLAMTLQKSGYEHGYTFEVRLVLQALEPPGADPRQIWMQLVVGGKMGPDIGHVVDEGGSRMVRLIQAKSYQDINTLMRASDTGEIWSQLRSDLLRLAREGFMVTGPDGIRLPIDRKIEFAVDWWHLRKSSFRIEGIDSAELHALPQGTPATSLAFYDQFIHEKAMALQELLDSPAFRQELADLGYPLDAPGFVLDVNVVDRFVPSP